MASTLKPLRLAARHVSKSPIYRVSLVSQLQFRAQQRCFSYSLDRLKGKANQVDYEALNNALLTGDYSKEDENDEDGEDREDNSVDAELRIPGLSDDMPREFGEVPPLPPPVPGFFAFGEQGVDNLDDDEFDMDDISSTAHSELEQVRELREFYRVQGWDMPLLYQHAKPFQPPSTQTPLRFRYTSYMGETHPGSNKVVMDFQPAQLPNLTQIQRDKLIKLLGSRYDPHKETAKMSCERYPTAPQNKNHLIETLESLLKESREGQDTFEDVPFDFRHARFKKSRPKFPEHWKLVGDRRSDLELKWHMNDSLERAKEREGNIVDSKKLMDLPKQAATEEPEMIVAERRKNR